MFAKCHLGFTLHTRQEMGRGGWNVDRYVGYSFGRCHIFRTLHYFKQFIVSPSLSVLFFTFTPEKFFFKLL